MKRILDRVRGVLRSYNGSNCPLHAAGLTYFTLMAFVPVLCLVLFFAKQAGVDHYARDFINGKIDAVISNVECGQESSAASGLAAVSGADEEKKEQKRIAAREFASQARKISDQLFERIEQFNVKTLGWIGFGMLLWTVISTLSMVENTFNLVWEVPKVRPVWKRALLYLFVALVMPILAGMAMSMPVISLTVKAIRVTLGATWLTKWVGDGLVAVLESGLFSFAVSLVFLSLACAFVLWVMPNYSVRWRPAVSGGFITAVLFGGWVKLCAIAQVGIANSSAMYGSFAFLPIVLAWLYMSWQIILIGACITHSLQKVGE